ncbi:MAG: carboxylesterase family protein [Actinomycetaceae bacterium]|nr:carboxylesterase family protein [Actinomycetaceae bacterium]
METIEKVIRTEFGYVKGETHPSDENVLRFLGIPYAAAPTGDLYLAAPAPHPGWDGVRDATELPPTPQKRPYSDDALLIDPSIPGDEILNLNVFTPKDAQNLPVLVWIHGGGFKSGVAASPLSDGRKFASKGIVFVSLSYRLGFEGFGWVKDAPANRGFLDQQAALAWVRRNIEAFGGDPNRVTISGQSAGGGSVLAHLTTPTSQHLFDRAISESGVLPPMSEEEARYRAQMVADLLGVELTVEGIAGAKERLLDAEVEVETRIYEAWPGASSFVADRLAGIPMSDLPFTPWQDGEVIPYTIDEGVERGVGADKPLLLTATSEEFNDILAGMAGELDALDAVQVLTEGGLENAQEYVDAHPRANTTSLILGQIVTDAIFVWPAIDIMRRRRADGAAHTAMYLFEWSPALDDPTVNQVQQWSRHCIDIPFAFDLLEEPMALPMIGDNPPVKLAQDLHGQWVDFTKGRDVPGNVE